MDRINNLIYFNNNRTTHIDEAVREVMARYLPDPGYLDETVVEKAKLQLADLLNAEPGELLFTSGTTESVRLAMKGAFNFFKEKGSHIITTTTEPPAVLECCKELASQGAEITYLGVDREGLIDPSELRAALKSTTILVSIMTTNNETGVIQPIEKISEICNEHSVFFFSDASQYAGKMRCDVKDLALNALAFGAHKMYGPNGIGILYIENRYKALMDFIRSGYSPKLSLAQIAGFGKAAEVSAETQWDVSAHISKLKNYLEHQLLDIEGLRINGSTRHRLYTTSNLTFPDAKKIVHLMDRFEFAGNSDKPSHVLKAMGLSNEDIKNSFCFSFGKYNTLDEVKLLVEEILRSH